MKLRIIGALIFAISLFSCGNSPAASDVASNSEKADETNVSGDWESKYDKIEAKDIPDNLIQLISEDWMLVTAGNQSSYNTMTASWGGMGYVWERPVSFIFIRDTRYTFQFLEKEDSFTLSFFTEEHRGALRICGTKSGRDTDKVKEAGLTPVATPSGLMSFGEARLIVECKKMYVDQLGENALTTNYKSEIKDGFYKKETAPHTLFISEITNVWLKK